MNETVLILTAQEIETELGTIVAGTPMPATPAADGGWTLELSLPGVGIPSHPIVVGHRKIHGGLALLNAIHAQHDYRFAREMLGLDHAAAWNWVRDGYGVSDRQLFRWGLSAEAWTEAAA